MTFSEQEKDICKSNYRNICFIIPALNPTQTIKLLVADLVKQGASSILIVDDGSWTTANSVKPSINIFKQLEDSYKEVLVLRHAINLGKGQALKTAFNHALLHMNNLIGVITLDADGQHLAKDALKVGEALLLNQNSLIMGTRSFAKETPLRSKVGNIMTKAIFNLIIGKKISDTQTGLRGIPAGLLSRLLSIKSSGYDFELEMLTKSVEDKTDIVEIPIETIYEDGNSCSHFNPLFDSFKIYFVFLRYLTVSISSFVLDYFVFLCALFLFTASPWILHAVTRILTSSVNFYWNKKYVFKSKEKFSSEIIKYFESTAFILITSTIFIYGLIQYINIDPVLAKPLADSAAFLFSFALLRSWVFK